MPKLAVLGQPISHSRSPAMQNAALAELGLAPEWTYGAIEVARDDFAALVAELAGSGYAGVNVTVPHKIAALAVADEASPAAAAIGAANTLSFGDGRVGASNSDGVGILNALPRSPEGKRALVLGAGGSARAAIWGLRNAGAEVHVWNRTHSTAEALALELGAQFNDGSSGAAGFDLIVNATTVGLEAANAATRSEGQPLVGDGLQALKELPIDADSLHAEQVVVDLVYGSQETQLITAARRAGGTPVDGLEVLVRQGAASLRLWTGAEPPIDTMRAAARGEVSA